MSDHVRSNSVIWKEQSEKGKEFKRKRRIDKKVKGFKRENNSES